MEKRKKAQKRTFPPYFMSRATTTASAQKGVERGKLYPWSACTEAVAGWSSNASPTTVKATRAVWTSHGFFLMSASRPLPKHWTRWHCPVRPHLPPQKGVVRRWLPLASVSLKGRWERLFFPQAWVSIHKTKQSKKAKAKQQETKFSKRLVMPSLPVHQA